MKLKVTPVTGKTNEYEVEVEKTPDDKLCCKSLKILACIKKIVVFAATTALFLLIGLLIFKFFDVHSFVFSETRSVCRKEIYSTINLYPLFCIVAIIVLSVMLIILLRFLLKDDTALKIIKLNELQSIKSEISKLTADEAFDKTTEEIPSVEKSEESKDKKETQNLASMTTKSNKAALLKHYMNTLSEI